MTDQLNSTHPGLTVVAVSGKPRPRSRTLAVADAVAQRVAAHLGGPTSVETIDLATVANQLFSEARPDIDRLRQVLARATVAVVATPVYQASYTGLLKSFLDRYPGGGLKRRHRLAGGHLGQPGPLLRG